MAREIHILQNRVDPSECLWYGKPEMLPYILVNRHVAAGAATTVFLFLWQGSGSILAVITALLTLVAAATGVLRWKKQAYYATRYGLVVESGEQRYCLYWQEIRPEEVQALPNPLERLFGCGTVKYAYRPRGGGRTDPWREKTRFWCIREYDAVQRMISAMIQ